MVHYQTAQREYFDSVIKEIRKAGFEFMAWVTMNSVRNKYHVDMFRFAQVSRLFFLPPVRSLIVQLEFTELFGQRISSDDWDENWTGSYWGGDIYYAYSRKRWVETKATELNLFPSEVDSPRIFDFIEAGPFRITSGSAYRTNIQWSFEQRDIAHGTANRLEGKEIAAPFGKILEILNPFLYRRFRELQVTGFPPYYTFKGQESDFWAKFPLTRLKGVVDHIWGGDFPNEGKQEKNNQVLTKA